MDTGSDSTTRRLIIHCGVQKTGSTSLHHFLRRNDNGLATRDPGNTAMRFGLRPSKKRLSRLRECASLLHMCAGGLELQRLVNQRGLERPVRRAIGELIARNQRLFVS